MTARVPARLPAVIVVALVALVACGGAPPGTAPAPAPAPVANTTPARDPFADTRAQVEQETLAIEALSVEVCGCAEARCAHALDDQLSAWMRQVTLDDVITNIETWPPELDERAQVAYTNIEMCTRRLGATMFWWGELTVRRSRDLRDRMCACADLACAERVRARWREVDEDHADVQPTPSGHFAIQEYREHGDVCFDRLVPVDEDPELEEEEP